MNKSILKAGYAAVLLSFSSASMAYVVDGDLSDWGITPTGSASDWTPNTGVIYTEEDQHDNFLNPGYGGQIYDAEAIYLDWDNDTLYYAVVTGRPQTETHYPSGDIFFDFGSNGSYEFAVETRGNTTTESGASTVGAAKGDLYLVGTHENGDPYTQSGATELLTGNLVSSNNLVYSNTPITNLGGFASTDEHYVIEGSISLADFSLYTGEDFTVHWTMGCGNDAIDLEVGGGLPSTGVPLPATTWLLGVSLIGLGANLRRKRRS